MRRHEIEKRKLEEHRSGRVGALPELPLKNNVAVTSGTGSR
jgi:hypothetical protein